MKEKNQNSITAEKNNSANYNEMVNSISKEIRDLSIKIAEEAGYIRGYNQAMKDITEGIIKGDRKK